MRLRIWAPSCAFALLLCGSEGAARGPGEVLALIESGTAFVPLRTVLEWLGATVDYRGGTITARREDDTVVLTIGSTRAKKNGAPVRLSKAPFVRIDTAYIPLRFVGEAFGATVAYDPGTRWAAIRLGDKSATFWAVPALPDTEHLACDVFRSLVRQSQREDLIGKRIVLFESSQYPWMRQVSPQASVVYAGDQNIANDPRFAEVMRTHGGDTDDAWYPYTVERRSGSHVVVTFQEWAVVHWVHLRRVKGKWKADFIRYDWDGNVNDERLIVNVRRVNKKWVFTESH